MTKKIGLSMSLCVRDLLDGKMQIENVVRLITNTRAPDDNAMNQLIREYSRTYWSDRGPEARVIIDQLEIIQPRLKKSNYLHIARPEQIWIDEGDTILLGHYWHDDPRGRNR